MKRPAKLLKSLAGREHRSSCASTLEGELQRVLDLPVAVFSNRINFAVTAGRRSRGENLSRANKRLVCIRHHNIPTRITVNWVLEIDGGAKNIVVVVVRSVE